MHIIDDRPQRPPLPMLFSLADMDRLRIFYDNMNHVLVSRPENIVESASRFRGHGFYRWNTTLNFFYGESQLRRLQRGFGHPGHMKRFDLFTEIQT